MLRNDPIWRHGLEWIMNLKTKMPSLQTVTMDENLKTVYRHCVYNLDSVHPYTIPDIHFEFDGASWVCSRALPHPLTFATVSPIPILESALIFQVIGQISISKPIFTQEGQHKVQTSFWIESRPDAAARALWSHIPESLQAIAHASEVDLDFSKLYETDASGVLRLKVVWTGEVSIPALVFFLPVLSKSSLI
jgi:hypothetical protein